MVHLCFFKSKLLILIWIVTFYSKKDFEIIASSTSFYSYFINASKIQINFFLKERQEIIWQLNILATRPFGMSHGMSHVTETVLEMMRISSCRVLSPNFSWLKGPCEKFDIASMIMTGFGVTQGFSVLYFDNYAWVEKWETDHFYLSTRNSIIRGCCFLFQIWLYSTRYKTLLFLV